MSPVNSHWWDQNFRVGGKSYRSKKGNTLYFWVLAGNRRFRQSTTFESAKERVLLRKLLAVRNRSFDFTPEQGEKMAALIAEIAYLSKGHRYHHSHDGIVQQIDALLMMVDKEMAKLALC